MGRRRVIVESPFAGDVKRNQAYLSACLRDCLMRGEAPFASHAIYTRDGVLDDTVPEERKHGIEAGFDWRDAAHATVVYADFGVSGGMRAGIEHAKKIGHAIEWRYLYQEETACGFRWRPKGESSVVQCDLQRDHDGDHVHHTALRCPQQAER